MTPRVNHETEGGEDYLRAKQKPNHSGPCCQAMLIF